MTSLFDDLKEGLQEAIAFAKGEGPARVTRFEIEPVITYTNVEIREIRTNAKMTQAVFALYMGVSIKTVEAWESGRTHPTGPACRLMTILAEGKQQPDFVKVSQCGGMDFRTAADSRFRIITDSGEITAVVCCMPPHLSDGGEDKAPAADSIYLDTGLTAEEVKKRVSLGDTAAYDVTPSKLLNNRFTCSSTDNRASCAVLIRVAQMIKENPVNTGVTFAFTSQEETYGKGAMTSAYSVNPDKAICIDVSFAVQQGVSECTGGKLGEGAMICISPVLSKKMSGALTDIAKKHNIPYQLEVTGGLTGTNGDKISVTRSGIPTAVVSVPQRNMHTPAEVISLDDIENTARLVYEYLRSVC